jgi:hypothetical protein
MEYALKGSARSVQGGIVNGYGIGRACLTEHRGERRWRRHIFVSLPATWRVLNRLQAMLQSRDNVEARGPVE